MATRGAADFLAGVIEGFYGQPWSQAERFQLFEWMTQWGLNTYFYGPKDDLKHRALWRERYSVAETANLRQLIGACERGQLNFIYALSPGLDIRYSDDADFRQLQARFEQMLGLGCRHFALLFDDVPDRMHSDDSARWGSLAAAQSAVTNRLFEWTRERSRDGRFLFCPTPYCGRMAQRKLGGGEYLSVLGRSLLPEIDVFWTGPEIISPEITLEHVAELQHVLQRKPLIWDNLYANDYDGGRFFCGPYSGRPTGLRNAVSGLLVNPNNEFPLNYVPLRTFSGFVQSDGAWDPRNAYVSAMKSWLANFTTLHRPVPLEDLILFGDCYYLPHHDGPEAEKLYRAAQFLLSSKPSDWGEHAAPFVRQATRLIEFCVQMTELRERSLFYALSRRVWELREELDLLVRYVQQGGAGPDAGTPFFSDSHLAHVYRGGIVARLQRLLVQQIDGALRPWADSGAAKPSGLESLAGLTP